MKLLPLFQNYELLVDKAEKAFHQVSSDHAECVKCGLHCSDCCHAVFGLFLIEAAYVQQHFVQLNESVKEAALLRAEKADRDIEKLQEMLKTFENDPRMTSYTLARERIRCPLLDDQGECVLYHRRPLTCRVYGIPTKIGEKAHVCGKAAFKKDISYPVFDLDGAYRDLFCLSRELLVEAGDENLDKASLLVSLSKAIRTPVEDLIRESLEGPVERS
ncbi:MAG: YkgJ family cysteine cluster protein [Pseudomonadota bacterium]